MLKAHAIQILFFIELDLNVASSYGVYPDKPIFLDFGNAHCYSQKTPESNQTDN
jgi:hypothetical protein